MGGISDLFEALTARSIHSGEARERLGFLLPDDRRICLYSFLGPFHEANMFRRAIVTTKKGESSTYRTNSHNYDKSKRRNDTLTPSHTDHKLTLEF